MISYTVFFILNAVLLFGLIKKKKKIFAVIGVCTEVALLCLIILGLLGISLTPLAFLILIIAAALWCLLEIFILFFKSAKITVTVAAVLAVLLIVAIVPFYPAFYVYFVLNAALIFASIKNKKKKPAVIGTCIEIALLFLIVFRVISIPSVYYTVNIAAALWCLTEMYILFFKSAKITVIVASVLCVLFIAATVFYYPAYLKRTVDGTDYMAVYSKWTGVSETKVSYHHMYNSLFMTSDASYTENYGILFCGWEDVFNYEPYSVSK